MNATHDRAKSIFLSAAEIAAPDERRAYVDAQCAGDDTLRNEVDQLLRHQNALGSFLESPVIPPPRLGDGQGTIDSPIVERPGTVIGPYKLLQKIGEGGFGIVFLAEQAHPVKRRVALKVVKPGMDTREVIGRFAAERQALAMMDHPSIAKVHDGGVTDSGRPYFVMELVQGVPITEYCDQCNLTTIERLGLFIQVCQAAQHAHQKGVIHRDIKPTNVLVAIQDGQPAPKIIDFGVAKAINQQLTEHTLMTAFAQMVGTPLYMSPEQAELSPLGVDTRSDIYSLGVLLYELLTGTTPFDKDRIHAATYDELRRIIREEEPPRPSARISTLAANRAATVAEHRRTDARRLRQTIDGDLDWIVMKCLEKDRNRRYDSAGSLARDIDRHLHDEAVQACPPSTVYRFRKFACRNKTLLAAGGAISAALLVGVGLSTWMYSRAAAERTRFQAVSHLLQEMLGSADAERANGINYTVGKMLDDFSASLPEKLAAQPEVEADIYATIGGAYRSLGMPDKAQKYLEKAIELTRQVYGPDSEKLAVVLVNNGWNLQDQSRDLEAAAQLREALEIYKQRGVNGSPVIRAYGLLLHVLISFRRYDEAGKVIHEAMAVAGQDGEQLPEMSSIVHQHARLRIKQGEFAKGEQLARQAIEMRRRLYGNQHPDTGWALRSLADALEPQGKLDEAELALRESLEILRGAFGDDHRFVRWGIDHLKSVLWARGDQSAIDALARQEANLPIRSDAHNYDLRLATLLLSNNPTNSQKVEAHRLLRRTIDNLAQVAVETPDNFERRLVAADGYLEVARTCASFPDFGQEVDEVHRRLMTELSKLLHEYSASSEFKFRTALIYRGWALALPTGAYLSTSEQALRDAISCLDKVTTTAPSTPGLGPLRANIHSLLGDVLQRAGRMEDAEAAFRQAMKIYRERAEEIAIDSMPVATSEIVSDNLRLAYFLVAAEKEKEAGEFVHQAALHVKHIRDSNASADALYYLAVMQLRLGDMAGYRATCNALAEVPFGKLSGLKKSRPIWTRCLGPDAIDDPKLSVKLAEQLVSDPSVGELHFRLYVLGATHYRSRQFDQAAQRLAESIAAFPSYSAPVTDSKNYHRLFLAMTQWQLGQKGDARRLLTDTLPDITEELESPTSTWNRRATLEILRHEAEALIEPKEANEAVENENTGNNEPKQPSALNPEP